MAERSVVLRSCSRSERGSEGSEVDAVVGVPSSSFWSLLISISFDRPSSRR